MFSGAGCAVRGDVELLESELRRHEQLEEDLNAQLQTAREELRIARADAEGLRAQLSSKGKVALAAEQAEVLYKVEAIRFNTLLTSGVDRDGQPGDDGLSVLLLPVDMHGDLVKLVGAIELELLDLGRSGDEQRIGRWQFSVDEVREHWHKGFLSAGYLFQLDWQAAPTSRELTLHARFTAPDARVFDATAQVKVMPPQESATPLAAAKPEAPRTAARVTPVSHARESELPVAPRRLRDGAAPRITPQPGAAGAGHATLNTSDNYTEATIPHLR